MFKVNTKNIALTQTVYLSGPMTGLPDYNRAAFNLRAEAFRAAGYSVKNPADISVTHGTDKAYEFYFKRALRMMLDADVSNVKCLTFANADVAEFTVPEGAKITKHLIKDLGLPKGTTCLLYTSPSPRD